WRAQLTETVPTSTSIVGWVGDRPRRIRGLCRHRLRHRRRRRKNPRNARAIAPPVPPPAAVQPPVVPDPALLLRSVTAPPLLLPRAPSRCLSSATEFWRCRHMVPLMPHMRSLYSPHEAISSLKVRSPS